MLENVFTRLAKSLTYNKLISYFKRIVVEFVHEGVGSG